MNRKKPKRRSSPPDRDLAPGSAGEGDAPEPAEPAAQSVGEPPVAGSSTQNSLQSPTQAVRVILSTWVVIHLLAILISFTSVVEPSAVHSQLSELVHPYLRPAHFSADDRPVYLAHGDPSEQPHLLQVTRETLTDITLADSHRWTTVGPETYAGLAASDRVSRWLSTAAMLSENDQPGLVAELLLPIALRDSSVKAIRILQLPTDLADINAEAEPAYVASVIRNDEQLSLVQLNPARLSSRVLSTREPSGDE